MPAGGFTSFVLYVRDDLTVILFALSPVHFKDNDKLDSFFFWLWHVVVEILLIKKGFSASFLPTDIA